MLGVVVKSKRKNKPDPGRVGVGRFGDLAILNWLRDCLLRVTSRFAWKFLEKMGWMHV